MCLRAFRTRPRRHRPALLLGDGICRADPGLYLPGSVPEIEPMTAVAPDYAVDRLEDDGGRIRPNGDGDLPVGRLVWAPPVEGRRLDGAWWPRSRDAVAELGALVPAVSDYLRGPVTRVSLNIDAWGPDQPRRLRIGDVLVRLGWFHTLDAATVTLGRGTYGRVTLAVIPPDLDPPTGRELLRKLSTATSWPHAAAELSTGAWPPGNTGQDRA
jgi:hypothetical protein